MTIHIVTVPYRYDEYMDGLGRGPVALLKAGLTGRLQSAGIETNNPVEVKLPDEERVEGPVAANIGALGRHTASVVNKSLADGNPVLVLAGDDTASIGVVAGVQHAFEGKRLGLVWIDAHADFNTPETSFSGILAGMPVAILAGLAGPIWREAANLTYTLPTDQILVAGVRSTDEKELALLESTNLKVVEAKNAKRGDHYQKALDKLTQHVDVVVVNVDLDVLDPQYVPSASTPEADGLSIKQVASLVNQVIRSGKAAAICITSLNPRAGQRGEKSVKSTLTLLEQALVDWTLDPEEPIDE